MTDKTDFISYGFELSEAAAKDLQNRTSRNTIQNVCKICGAIIGFAAGMFPLTISHKHETL